MRDQIKPGTTLEKKAELTKTVSSEAVNNNFSEYKIAQEQEIYTSIVSNVIILSVR